VGSARLELVGAVVLPVASLQDWILTAERPDHTVSSPTAFMPRGDSHNEPVRPDGPASLLRKGT